MIEQSSMSAIALRYFDKDTRLCNIISQDINLYSPGEQLMLKFFANVWFDEPVYEFDIVYAASKLDQNNRQIIIDWLDMPFWP